MKNTAPKNRAASVRDRLLILARQRGEDYQITVRNYLFERFLYRLSLSNLKDSFVLKGAMLLRLWSDQPYRATADLDLLSRRSNDPESVRRDIASVCAISAPDEAASFDASSIIVAPIRADEEYAGARVMLEA